MASEEQPVGIQLPLVWVAADEVAVFFANQVIAPVERGECSSSGGPVDTSPRSLRAILSRCAYAWRAWSSSRSSPSLVSGSGRPGYTTCSPSWRSPCARERQRDGAHHVRPVQAGLRDRGQDRDVDANHRRSSHHRRPCQSARGTTSRGSSRRQRGRAAVFARLSHDSERGRYPR
jgi:hypothetical protein